MVGRGLLQNNDLKNSVIVVNVRAVRSFRSFYVNICSGSIVNRFYCYCSNVPGSSFMFLVESCGKL